MTIPLWVRRWWVRVTRESCDYCNRPAVFVLPCGKRAREAPRPLCAWHGEALGRCDVCGALEPLTEVYFNPRRGRTPYDDPADYDCVSLCASCGDPDEQEARQESARGEHVDRQIDELQLRARAHRDPAQIIARELKELTDARNARDRRTP